MNQSLLLLSGGLDSLSVLYWKRPSLALTINYGQLAAKAEISAARAQCGLLRINHQVLEIDCGALGLGLMSDDCPSPPTQNLSAHPEWWPYRNQLLITMAAATAIKGGLRRILIGTVASDKRHRDGTPAFFTRVNALLGCQEGRLSVNAPAIRLSTLGLMRRAKLPVALVGSCYSCHTSNEPCGRCPGCTKQAHVLAAWLKCVRH